MDHCHKRIGEAYSAPRERPSRHLSTYWPCWNRTLERTGGSSLAKSTSTRIPRVLMINPSAPIPKQCRGMTAGHVQAITMVTCPARHNGM